MTFAENALDVALKVAKALESVGCEYFIGGSLASSLQGEPRATNDIDIVVAMMMHKVRPFSQALGADFEVDEEMLRDAIRHSSCANIFYLPTITKVDLFSVGTTAYDEVEFSRRKPVIVRTGETLFLKSAEDTVLRKLLWFRQGGEVASKQWRDVVQVLRINASILDTSYLQIWAGKLHIDDLLACAHEAARTAPT